LALLDIKGLRIMKGWMEGYVKERVVIEKGRNKLQLETLRETSKDAISYQIRHDPAKLHVLRASVIIVLPPMEWPN
jgi:hypothetical protein